MRRYLAIPLLLLVAGCGAQVLREGEPNFNTAILLPYATTPERQAAAARDIARLGLTPTDLPSQCSNSGTVNGCVYAVKAIIDDLYREYRITLHHFADDGNAAADITVLGLTTAATGPVGSTAKTILSGVATLVGGSKSILNQDLLFQKAIEDVINQMDIDRDTQFNTMLQEMRGSYTLDQAKADLLEYFAAGTWDHAIVSLQTTVAAKKAKCKTQTDAAKVAQAQDTSAGVTAAGAPATTPASTATLNPASTDNCGPALTQASALTPDIAKAGSVFATSNQTFVQVVTAAKSTSDNITIKKSTNKSDFSGAKSEIIKFSTFVLLVKPTPIN